MDGILWEISHLKQELDAINEELGLCIRKNKDIDSKTLRISEATKKYMEKEESTKNSVILKDNQFKDLNILSGKRHAYILQETGSIHDIEEVINEITSKVSKERDIEENEEVRKQLKDLVVGLRIQLSHLIDQR